MTGCLYNVHMSLHPFTEFVIFTLVVLKQKIFSRSLLVCVAAFILQYLIPEFSLPLVFYLAIIFVGFVWSAYQVDSDLSQAYRKLMVPVAAKTPNLGLSISFAPGNEFNYSICDPYDGKNIYMTRMQNTKGVKCHYDERGVFFINGKVYYSMAAASLDATLHIQNPGNTPLDVLLVDLKDSLNLNHLLFFSEGVFRHGRELQYPFQIKSGELVALQIRYKITINRGSSDALFAADLQALPRSILQAVTVNTKTVNGVKQSFTAEIKIPSKPLVDLYVKQWREYDQEEYLVLSGHDMAEDTQSG